MDLVHRRRSTDSCTHVERSARRRDNGGAVFVSGTRTNRFYNYFASLTALLLAVALAGCAPATSDVATGTTRSTRPATQRDATQPASVEAVFDPAQHRVDDVRTEAEQIIRQIAPPRVESVDTRGDTVGMAFDTTWVMEEGYRIQISASPTREDAENVAMRARERFPYDSVYVYFQAPWYKVRVGDFETREDAETKLREARQKGYREAFWVPTAVRVPRISQENASKPRSRE